MSCYFRFASTTVLLLLTGCRLGPVYEPPPVCVPEEWKGEAGEINDLPAFENWWEVFCDEILDGLEARGIDQNRNLAQAFARIQEARSVVEINRSALFPQLTLNPSYSNTGQLFKIYVPQGLFPNLSPNLSVFRIHQFQYLLPLNMNYELDLWGRLQGQYESSIFAAQAQDEDYLNILLTLTTDIASNYYQLRLLDSQIAILKATIVQREKSLSLNQTRLNKGLGNALNVASASLEVSNSESSYYDALRQRAIIENVLAVLIGVSPSEFHIAPHPLCGQPPIIPANVPSVVLMQRPDIAEAERRCASEQALIGVAYASYFPSISLTGTLGYSSPDLKDFLKWISRLWSIGVNGSQTVFDGGNNEGNTIGAWARFMESSYAYQQVVLTAFQDVENALTNLEFQNKQYVSLSHSVQSARLRSSLTHQQNIKGLVNYLDVVNSEEAALSAEINLSNIHGQVYLSTVQLIKALGGCWQ